VESVQHLVVGTFAAVGAALALGTGAALVRYHRTGRFPGQPQDSGEPVRRGQLVGMWARVVVGTVVAVAGVLSLRRAGLL
jgi:hypothetical protein